MAKREWRFYATLPGGVHTREWEQYNPIVRYLPSMEPVGRATVLDHREDGLKVEIQLTGKLAPALLEAWSAGSLVASWATEPREGSLPVARSLDLSPE